jgi:hypothetical protein
MIAPFAASAGPLVLVSAILALTILTTLLVCYFFL